MFIKHHQVKVQKQGQNTQIQHGFILYVGLFFSFLPIEQSNVKVQFSWKCLITAQTLDSSQAVRGYTGASWGIESPSLRKYEGKEE